MYRNTRYFANRWQNYYKNFIYANFREIFSPNSIKFYVYRANMGRLCLHKTTDRRTINKAQSAGEKISRKLPFPLSFVRCTLSLVPSRTPPVRDD